MKPGNLMALLIYQITGEMPCQRCLDRKYQMNTWGWFECWKKRRLIVGWLKYEALAKGFQVDDKDLISMFKSGIKIMRRNNAHAKIHNQEN